MAALQAAYLLDADMAPRALMKAVGLDTSAFFLGKMSCLNKYDPDQPRHPAGSGQDSGRWSRGPGSGTSLSLAPNAAGVPSLAAELAPEAVAWLVRFAARLSLPTAVLGAALIPSANPGLAEEGAVPGCSDLRYHLDRDAGLLRLSAAADPDSTHALVAQLGSGDLYREVETGVPVARAVGDAVTLIDLDRAPVEKDEPDGDRKAATSWEGPKLRPAPSRAGACSSTSPIGNSCAISSTRNASRSFRSTSPSRCPAMYHRAGCISTIAARPTAR